MLLALGVAILSQLSGVATGHAQDDQAETGTLQGQVLIGPVCPLARPNPPPGCEDQPYQATVSVQTPDGAQELCRFDTDEQGQFSIDLAAGDYLLVPVTPPGRILPRGQPQVVTVVAGQITLVELHFDSGLR